MDHAQANAEPILDCLGYEYNMDGEVYAEVFTREECMRLAYLIFRLDPKYSDLLATDASVPIVEA